MATTGGWSKVKTATTTITVLSPSPPYPTDFTMSISTDKTQYNQGDKIYITAYVNVGDGQHPVTAYVQAYLLAGSTTAAGPWQSSQKTLNPNTQNNAFDIVGSIPLLEAGTYTVQADLYVYYPGTG